MDLLEWFFVAVLLILLCLAYSPLFILLFKILSPIFKRIVAWFKRPNIQQVKEEEARQLECDRELKRLSDEHVEKRTAKRKQKIQNMLLDGSLGKLNKTVCLTSITLSARVASTENVTTNVNAINPVSRWFFCQSTLLAFLPRSFYASLSL